MPTKDELRAHFKHMRAAIPKQERVRIDHEIARRVLESSVFAACTTLCTYISFGAEVDTREIIQEAWRAGKQIALPRVVAGTRTMKWYAVDSFDGLETSNFGVEEPPENPQYEIDPAKVSAADPSAMLALVPGLTFDSFGFRLGYGGGFYDVFLERFSGTSVGLCRTCQLSERLGCLEYYDRPVDFVVTETSGIDEAG